VNLQGGLAQANLPPSLLPNGARVARASFASARVHPHRTRFSGINTGLVERDEAAPEALKAS
jgi:hypothetical protein